MLSTVETRARTCEQWLPLWRALNANQGESVELKLRIKLIREAIRQRMEVMYEPELATQGSEPMAPPASTTTSASYRVYVTNEMSGDMTVIDGDTRQVLATVPLGKRERVPVRRNATLLDRRPLADASDCVPSSRLVEGRIPRLEPWGVSKEGIYQDQVLFS